MRAAAIARALELPIVDPEELVWGGTRDGLAFGVIGAQPSVLAPEPSVRLYSEHAVPLRLGLLAESARPWGASDPLREVRPIVLGDSRIEGALRVRAVEHAVARAILRDVANLLVTLLGDGRIVIDDHRVWLTLGGADEPHEVQRVADRMTEVSSRLATAREGREANFETAIAPLWSRLAFGAGLEWFPDRSTIEGEVHGATIEARIDGDPCLLYTEVFVEWPELGRGLAIERTEARGSVAWEPPSTSDAERLLLAFDRELRGRRASEERGVLPTALLHAALSIATTGASLAIDDTGLVTRLDSVAATEATMGRLFRGALAITTALLAPDAGPTKLYR